MENKDDPQEPRRLGRPRTIDRERLLDAAEEIVTQSGAAALTIDAVARAAGVTKGGVQYAFGSKEALIQAMFDRWDQTYEAIFRSMAGPDATPAQAVRAHVEGIYGSDDNAHAKAASLLAALIRTPEHLAATRAWYRQRIAALDLDREEDRRARLAFLAAEGAFMLRFFGLMEIDEAEWRDIFADIRRFTA
ncbi:TetR/AcrR family transcriptional regulator [Aquibium sp. A9E412]|uniref:TetR/AcrR family transcriptional regulator n=1 Tax=Aquibium sp. A9E412 TaxID=2976767 RepID=UPI0025B13CAB|nr:TetR/AcrR family transcriptional regulator [Aquibium sp. A9E412]MDN2566496.1 TetR/AcrR family transcriptional regulator [Aquibium sp. A9E412]